MFFGVINAVFPLVFTVGFVLIAAMVVVTLARSFREWNHNNQSPVLEVEAGVVSRRTDVSHNMHHTGNDMAIHSSTSTTYYVTFQVHSGDRMEFRVSGQQYGLIAEGDFGTLTFQGSRFLKFERT